MWALLRCRLLGWYRQLRSHAFELFVLGPVVLGGAVAIADRYLMVGAPYLAKILGSPDGARRCGLLLAFLVSALMAAGVFRELYGERAGTGLFDILPIAEWQRLVLAGLAAAVAAGPGTLAFGAAGAALAHWTTAAPFPWPRALALSFIALLALVLLDFLLLQLAVRLGLLSALPLAIFGTLLLGGLMFAPASPLLLPWRLPGDLLARVWVEAAGQGATLQGKTSGLLGGLALHIFFCGLLAAILFLRYRSVDSGRAQALRANVRAFSLLPAARRPWTALVRRDLLLVLRRFSPLVPLAFAASLLLLALLPLLVSRSGLAPAPLARTFSTGAVLAIAAWVALLPYLLAAQLRTFWLESSLGTTAVELGRAKAVTALVLAAVPALIAAGLALWLLPSEGGLSAIAICGAALTLAITMGLTIWETPFEPAIGLIYGLLVGGAVAALFVLAPAGWLFWLAAYTYLATQLLGRVRERVASLEQPR